MAALLTNLLRTTLGDEQSPIAARRREQTRATQLSQPEIPGRGQGRGAAAAGTTTRGATRRTTELPGTGSRAINEAFARRLSTFQPASDRRTQLPRTRTIPRSIPEEDFRARVRELEIQRSAEQIEEQAETGRATEASRAARRRQRARAIGARGRRDTILTSSLGITGEVPGRRRTLLGA